MRRKTKTDPYGYRLGSKQPRFRLEINSLSQRLWNHYLEKKKNVKLAMWEIARLAREELGDTHQNETFINSMINELGMQKAHDRIFELAVERRYKLERSDGRGRIHILLPDRVRSLGIEEPKTETGLAEAQIKPLSPRVTTEERVERKPDIVPQMPQALEKIYLDFPPSLRELLTFEYDEPSRRIKIKGKQWIGEPVLTEIRDIVEKHQGRWVKGLHWTQSFWVIPQKS